ncbi:tektin-1 [Lepisosteus oculatus]|uniref:tektin-1 n=1 Tax=Lepisosteus oculatus TaxID=7918 RepID=UPI00371B5666
MSRLIQLPPKFLPPEWQLANQMRYSSAAAERSRSERLSAESQRLVEETEKATRRAQEDVTKKLEQRIEDIKFWKQELDTKLAELVKEIDVLLTYKTRLEKALESCAEPLRVTQQCLAERESRVGIDLVHDEVERELIKELEVIEGVTSLLKRTLEQTNEQIRLNRSAKYYLEKDLRDKFQAEIIDDQCAVLTSNSPEIHYSPGASSTAQGAVTPGEWEDFSNLNIVKADKQKNNSLSLRTLIDSLLEQTADDLSRQHQAVSNALQIRVRETKSAKSHLEEHLAKVMEEISSQERNIAALKQAIAEKEGPLKLAQTRLQARSQRPNVELCHDPAQARLLHEVQEITGTIERLSETLALAEAEMRALTRSQLSLEEEIEVKARTVYIDEVVCTQLRQPIAFHHF